MPDHAGPAVTQVADEATDRFARQRGIPGWDQRRLTDSTVIILGIGALGNEVAKNLALAGVGRLVLCDPDVVSVSNLSRTVLFRPSDVGSSKVTAAAAALDGLVPGIRVEPRVADLVSGVGLGELSDAALVVGCIDTIRARIQLLSRCVLVDAPLLDGGTSPWGGEIRVRLPADEACFACGLTPHQRSASDLPWSCAEPVVEEEQAVGIATTALTAGWLTVAAFSLLFGRPLSYRVLTIDASTGRAAPVTVGRDQRCPLHRPLTTPMRSSPVDNQATVAEFLATLGPSDEVATWNSFPIPAAQCRRCGNPLTTGSAQIRCPRCGGAVRETRSTRLRDASPGTMLAALGVAPEEILPVITVGGELECHRLKSSQTPPTSR